MECCGVLSCLKEWKNEFMFLFITEGDEKKHKIGGAYKAGTTDCKEELFVAIYLTVQGCLGAIFWPFLVERIYREKLQKTIRNPCTYWTIGRFSEMKETCVMARKDWTKQFITFGVVVTAFHWLAMAVFVLYVFPMWGEVQERHPLNLKQQ